MLADKRLRDLLEAFGSADPTPGGGSASALAGALGASLLLMVSRLPKTRNKSDEDRTQLDRVTPALEALRDSLRDLVDRDSDAYEAVVEAYRLPKETPDEKFTRTYEIQQALQQAIETPLAVMRRCNEALDHAAVVAKHGSRSASSDVAVGLELLSAGLHGAGFNAEINLGSVTDAAYVEATRKELRDLEAVLARRSGVVRDLLAPAKA